TLVIVHFLLVWGAANTTEALLTGKITWPVLSKPLYYSMGIIVGLMLVGYLLVDFTGPRDIEFRSSIAQSTGADFANKLLHSLQEDRKSMAWSDVLRGIMLSALLLATLWAYYNRKLNQRIFTYLLFLLMAYDLIGVGKRYFNNADFTAKKGKANEFIPTAADLEILKDQDPNFKVINVTTSFTQDARDSYFHKSLGGYHGAKLKKTQELYDQQLVTAEGQLNMQVIDMLNTKYLITNSPNGPVAQLNAGALGNAWFIDTLQVVPSADEELAALAHFQAATTAITQENQGLAAKTYAPDSTDAIRLTSYEPNRLVYHAETGSPQYAVFSEIYYRGNKDWKSYIDGKETPHQKVNYVLRGMEIPSGKHEIVFEFKPDAVEKGKFLDLVASVALVLLGLAAVYTNTRKKNTV
ncbi:MAG: YfhO family protein, partial [Anaerolineae bacterium]|nr:YfhO family protein [Anaerolineae bacterium]